MGDAAQTQMTTNKLILIAIALVATSAVRNDAGVPEHEFVEGLLSVASTAEETRHPGARQTRTEVYTIGDNGEAKTCITATGPYDHTKTTTKVSMSQPFVTCWQYDGTPKYCWSNSYDAGNSYARCEPQGSAGMWKPVEWYYVNPAETCGSPCDKMYADQACVLTGLREACGD